MKRSKKITKYSRILEKGQTGLKEGVCYLINIWARKGKRETYINGLLSTRNFPISTNGSNP